MRLIPAWRGGWGGVNERAGLARAVRCSAGRLVVGGGGLRVGGGALPASVGVTLDDQFVAGADEGVDGGLGE
jgi:hypothetical protein